MQWLGVEPVVPSHPAILSDAHLEDGLLSIATDGVVHSCNAAATAILGYSAAEIIGQPFSVFFNADQWVLQYALLRQASHGQTVNAVSIDILRRNHGRVTIELTLVPVQDANGKMMCLAAAFREVSTARQTPPAKFWAVDEMSHRIKNTLATVQSIARQAIRSATSLKDFAEIFDRRLTAIGQAHALIASTIREGVPLASLLEIELAPYGDETAGPRCCLQGVEVLIDPDCVISLSMILHELATNAAKYGALSTSEGRVDASWYVISSPSGEMLHFVWNETGGPVVEQPRRAGFGTRLIRAGVAGRLGGEVALTFDRAGVRCEMTLPHPTKFLL